MRRLYVTTVFLPLLLHPAATFTTTTTNNNNNNKNRNGCGSRFHQKKRLRSSSTLSVLSRSSPPPLQKPPLRRTSPLPLGFVEGPLLETKPEYEKIHGPFGKDLDRLFLVLFRTRMAEKVGVDSDLPADDYQGLMELTAAMNARYSDRKQVQGIAQDVLRSLFPSWLPPAFSWMFAKPFPEFSARMNAWATMTAGTWLMGECELYDVEIPSPTTTTRTLPSQGVLVKRCRFLEESGCASVCVNSCKIPTQNFFVEDMGLPLTMTPDYETGECRFEFGVGVEAEGESEAMNTPCLGRCPSVGGMRKWHEGGGGGGETLCPLMDEDMIE